MNGKTKRVLKTVLFISPFLLGVIGLAVIQKESLLDAMYACVQMYVLGYGGQITTPLVEIARWTAPLATASGILLVVTRIGVMVGSGIRYVTTDSVAVYGDRNKTVLKQLGNRAVAGEAGFVKAHRYILLGEEAENIAFYNAYRERLQDRMVYMKCTSVKAQTAAGATLKLFSLEETAARLFWKQQRLYERSVQKDHKLNIVLIGFGKLGEELLVWGVQNLIFAPDQEIHYHIFGDGNAFAALHPSLDQLGDSISFYHEQWYTRRELVEQADLVIVVQQQAQLKLLADLLDTLCRSDIHVFGAAESGMEMLEGRDRVHLFDWQQAALDVRGIMDDVLLERAKQINLRYAYLYGGVAETPENREAEWKKLDAFTRYSNISAADYHAVRLQMLDAMQVDKDAAVGDAALLDLLAELEHMRWCRYHYLNNWRYGVPENGKAKDPARRIHTALIPYGDLSDPEKEKDAENIRVLLSL